MKERHRAAYRINAVSILHSLRIAVGQDFHTLSSTQVEGLLDAADRERYQRPRNANASRARYYHDRLQRHAQLRG